MAGVWSASFVCGLFVCVASSQQIYVNNKSDCVRSDQRIHTLNKKIEYLRQENARQIDSLKRENAKKIDSLRRENARQNESFRHEIARQIDSLRRENTRITANQKKIQEEFVEMVNILKKNETNIHEVLKSSILQTIKTELKLYNDCNDLCNDGNTESGVYATYPFGNNSKVSVFCDMVTEGGGWTAIQRRVSGSVRFNRTWAEYKDGFGNVNDSYWIGNDVIHQLTKGRNSSLYVSITLTNGTRLYELYNQFSVADETNKYRLFLGGPANGTLGDSMLDTGFPYDYDLSGMSFSTPDRDNDRFVINCAALNGGGWWYKSCYRAFLNGPWSPEYWGWPWEPTMNDGSEINETIMMIRPL